MILIIVDGGLIQQVISEKDEKVIVADHDCFESGEKLLYMDRTEILTKTKILAIINELQEKEMKVK